MGSTVLYVLEWALALLLLLAVYKLFFSGTTLHRFNRCYLLGATVLSALLPFMHLTMPQAKGISIQSTSFAQMLQEVTIYADAPAEETVAKTASDYTWAWILVGIWALYVIVLITGWTRSIIRTERFLKDKPVHRIGGIRIVSHDEEFGPFSWMNCIVISKEEDGFARRASMRHELSHIRMGHYADLVFLLACTIVNPVCWLIMKEIKIVHEYEADDEVINRYGIVEKDYQRLLIMRTVGAEAYALASSFNLNIKQRITMMKKEKTLKRRTLWLIAVLPVIAIMSVVCSNTVSAAEILNQPVQEEPVKTGDVIKGTITDEEGNPLMMVNINEKDDTERIRAHSISDINGEYSFRLVNESDRLTIDYIGYEPVNLPIDKKVINITLKKMSNAATVSSLPGVEAKPDGTLTVNGKEVSKVLINGEEFDPKDLNMPMPEDDGYSEEETPFMVVEEMPEFPGGAEVALMEYLRTSIKYPEEARAKKTQGRVLVQFTVEKDGSITDVSLVKKVDPQLDAEAIRVISEMPKWKPGRQRGKEVRVRFTVPVNFRLN